MGKITKAWTRVTERIIINCFKERGFKVPCVDEEDDLPFVELATIWLRVREEFILHETEFEEVVYDDMREKISIFLKAL